MRVVKLGNQYALGKNTKESHVRWKGDDVKYRSLHKYVRKYFPPSELCENCKLKPPLDLANKTGIYNREFKNWMYLCRACHIRQDGRLYSNLKQFRSFP